MRPARRAEREAAASCLGRVGLRRQGQRRACGDRQQAGELRQDQPDHGRMATRSRSTCLSRCTPRDSATIPTAWRSCTGRSCCAPRLNTKQPVPAIVTEPGELLAALQPVPNKASTFAGSPRAFRLPSRRRRGRQRELEPFYKVHGNRHYVVYWDTLHPLAVGGQEGGIRRRAGSRKGARQPDDRPRQSR